MLQEGAVWGVWFVIHGGVSEVCRSGSMSFNSIVNQLKKSRYSPKFNNQPAFLLSSDKMHCNKLEQASVPTHSLKVYKLTEKQGGDCCNNGKSHFLGVHVKL